MHVYLCMCMYVCVCVRVYVCLCTCVYVLMCMCVYVCVCLSICVCVVTCMGMHKHTVYEWLSVFVCVAYIVISCIDARFIAKLYYKCFMYACMYAYVRR